MKRKTLYDLLNAIVPTYSVGQIVGVIKEDCIILRRSSDIPSLSNNLAYWEQWSIDIYSPYSPANVDDIVERVKDAIKEKDCKIENLISGDYYDSVLKAFSTTMVIQTPNIL